MYNAGIIRGNTYQDERGTLFFINDFDMRPVKRFYTIFHPDTAIVRAWQGHRVEQKWFFVLDGAFDIALVRPDDWSAPSASLPVELFSLPAAVSQVLHVPGGFATGFKATVPNSRMIVYSDCTLEDSATDDFRFEKHLWRQWV